MVVKGGKSFVPTLDQQIEQKRRELHHLTARTKNNFTLTEVIQKSKELDYLINLYYKTSH
jgi:hypothetical protein